MKTKVTLLGIVVFGAILLALPAAAQEQFDYVTNNDTLTIAAYSGSGGVVTIPSTYTGLQVTSIGEAAFEYSGITGIIIPTTVTNIGQGTFEGCSKLLSAPLPDSLIVIGNYAFGGCVSLTNITIPASATNIGIAAFATCSSVRSVTIPNTLTSIPENMFYNCSSLTSATIPNSVTSIGNDAFEGCASLATITISTNVTTIGESAFSTSGLTSVTIPASVTSIGYYSFSYCANLTEIAVDAANPDFSSANGVLCDKSQTTIVDCPNALAGPYTVPDTVTSVGVGAFDDCASLTAVTIPDSVTSIGDYAFQDCASMVTVTIGNGVTSIGDEAFLDCSSLQKISFQGDAPTPGFDMFGGTSAAATVYYLPDTTGWSTTYGSLPAIMANAPPQITDIGVKNNEFGFTCTGASNQVIVVQACTNLVNANWQPLQTNTLTGTSFDFTDSKWKNYPSRFYRIGAAP
jgi:hypothetical protein